MSKDELAKLERYLQKTFNDRFRVVAKKGDVAEVFVGDEFLGLIHLDDEDGDRSYSFQMAILAEDVS